MNKALIAISISACLFAEIASADTVVQFPSGNSAWTIDITYLKTAETSTPSPQQGRSAPNSTPAPRKAKRIEISRYNDQKETLIIWTDGRTSEQWSIGGMPVTFKQYANGNVFPVSNGDPARNIDSFDMPTDISAFSWVTPACLKEQTPVSVRGTTCYHYVGTTLSPGLPPGPGEVATPSAPVSREAWIDSKTQLPVALKTPTSILVFTFLPPPTGPLPMPPKIEQSVASYKHVMGF